MARSTNPLTNTEVSQAKPRDKEYSLVDGAGLALRVKPAGSKLWIFNYYRPYTKKRANISFGTYPEVTLADARRMRESARILISQDIDPKTHRDDQHKQHQVAHTNTLEHVADQWIEVRRSQVSADHADDIWRSLELHIFPKLGKLPLHLVTAPTTIAAIKPVAAKGSLETVRRLAQRLNEVMGWAVNSGLLETNPLAGIGKAFQTPVKNNLPTIKPAELPELIRALSTININLTTRHLIDWQLHTMVRPSEAAGTRWSEIDWNDKLWNIPAERMKKRRPHIVPLTAQTTHILQSMLPISGDREYVFTSHRDPRTHTNRQTANTAIGRTDYKGKLVSHGLRSLASTTLNENNFNPDVIEAALAHIDPNETRRTYNRAEYIEQRRTMMEWWSNHIEQAKIGSMGQA
jgi:integrase